MTISLDRDVDDDLDDGTAPVLAVVPAPVGPDTVDAPDAPELLGVPDLPDPAVEAYVLRAKLALVHAIGFLLASAAYVVLRVVVDVPHARTAAAAYLCAAICSTALTSTWTSSRRARAALWATALVGLGLVEVLIWVLLRGAQGTIVAGVTSLFVAFLVLNAVGGRLVRR